MNTKLGIMIALAAGGLASAQFRMAETLPALDPLVLVGVALIVAGAICWKHAG